MTTAPSSLPSGSSPPSASPTSRKFTTPTVVGAIIGGIIVTVVFATVVALVWKRRKTKQHVMYHPTATSETIDMDPMTNSQEPLVPSASGESADFFSQHFLILRPDSNPPLLALSACTFTLSLHAARYYIRLLDSDRATHLDSKHSSGSDKSTCPEAIVSASVPHPYSHIQVQVPETDVTTALNLITRMDPTQQHTLISVLNTLVPTADPPPYAPNPPSTTNNV